MASQDEKGTAPDPGTVQAAMKQLEKNQLILDYDTKEFTIEVLKKKFGTGQDENDDLVIPSYQRRFNWDERRQSRFIESLLIGLPVPFLFFADRKDGRLEVVDGRQRLETCRVFLDGSLRLSGLERLGDLDGFSYSDLSIPQQRRFRNRTIRAVVLSLKAKEEDRRDLFDRINTGSLIAEAVEIRRGSSSGPMTDLVDELADDERFKRLCPMSDAARNKREAEELITRFFGFGDGVQKKLVDYRDRPAKFLDEWMEDANKRAVDDKTVCKEYRARFSSVMQFIEAHFDNGFRKKPSSKATPRVRFDAISIGVWLALETDPKLAKMGPAVKTDQWLESEDFFILTTSSAANVRSRILNRVEYVKYMVLGNEAEAKKCAPEKA